MARKQAVPPTVKTERDQTLQDLLAVRAATQEFILMAGIQPAELEAAYRYLDEKPIETLQALLARMNELKDGPVKQVRAIWRLREPAFWEGLRMFGQTNTREQKLLRAALKALRLSWRQKNEQEAEAPVANGSAEGADVVRSESA